MKRLPIVLQLIDSLEVGGAEMMAVQIANALNRNGIVAHLAVSRKEGSLKTKLNKEVVFLFLNRKHLIDFKSFYQLYRYIHQHKIDIIHAHATSWFLAVVIKIFYPSIKIVWHDHFGFRVQLQQRETMFLKFGSLFFNAVITVNENLLNWAWQHLWTKHCFYLPNFVVENQKDADINLNGFNNKKIICVANFRLQKDHLNLLQAFKMVHQEFPDWTLHLVGNKSDLRYFDTLQDYIKINNLSENVFIYEQILDVSALLKQANIAVLSSKSEGLPLALLEYGLAKLGVVITDVGDCAKVLEHDKNGCLVPAENSAFLAEKIIFLIKNEEIRQLMGANLYQKIQKTYSEKTVCKQLIKIYQSIE